MPVCNDVIHYQEKSVTIFMSTVIVVNSHFIEIVQYFQFVHLVKIFF